MKRLSYILNPKRHPFWPAFTASAILPLLCGGFTAPGENEFLPEKNSGNKKRLELHGHRGARGLAPENTWPAFEKGIMSGMTAIEFDTLLTADGELIIHHDAFTNPGLCRNDDGSKIKARPIQKIKAADLKKLDCGSLGNKKFPEQKRIPFTRMLTMPEFFAKVRELEKTVGNARQVIFNIDVKFPPGKDPSASELREYARKLIQTVEAAGMLERVIIQSFETRLLPFAKEFAPTIRTSALFQGSKWLGARKRTPESLIARTLAVGADILAPHSRDADLKLIELAHARGITVIPWTVNDPGEMRALLKLGVDGLISDYPDRLRKVADELTQ